MRSKVRHLAVYVSAQDDPNGYPQRGWEIYRWGIGATHWEPIDFIDEGRIGAWAALKQSIYAGAEQGPRYEISRSHYHALARRCKALENQSK